MVEIISVKIAGGDITASKAAEIFRANLRAEGCLEQELQMAVMEDVMSIAQIGTLWDHQRTFTYFTEAQFREVLLGKIVHIQGRIAIVRYNLRVAETKKIKTTHKHSDESIMKFGEIPANLQGAVRYIVGLVGGEGFGATYGEANHNTDPVTKRTKAGQVGVREYYLVIANNRAASPYRFTVRSDRGKYTYYYSSVHIGNSYQYKLLCDDNGIPVVRDTANQWGDSILKVII